MRCATILRSIALAAAVSGWSVPLPNGAAAATNDLALAIARVAANEGALWEIRDADIVCQVVMGSADTYAGRLAWLKSHSGRVMKQKPCRGGNCLWSRNLQRDHGIVPAGIAAGKRDWWRAEMADRWEAVLSRAEACVAGRAPEPCHLPPTTWGSKRIDVEQAVARGLFPIGCDPRTLNDGFRSVGGFRW